MSSVITKRGDQGETDLMFGRRISKTSERVETYGTVDELNAQLGVIRRSGVDERMAEMLDSVQQRLIGLMGELATLECDLERYREKGYAYIKPEDVAWAEEVTKGLEQECEIRFRGWAIPGKEGNLAAAQLDLGRVICRRAERRVVMLRQQGDLQNLDVCLFLNRLSDLLWVMARYTALTRPE